jgi:hypothetical protein
MSSWLLKLVQILHVLVECENECHGSVPAKGRAGNKLDMDLRFLKFSWKSESNEGLQGQGNPGRLSIPLACLSVRLAFAAASLGGLGSSLPGVKWV